MDNLNTEMTCIEGVPGAGKTTALIEMAKEHVADQSFDNNLLCALTLTKTGAREIEERTQGAIAGRTIHSYCWKIIRTNCQQKHIIPPKIIDQSEADKLLLSSLDRSKALFEDVSDALQKTRIFGVPASSYSPDIQKGMEIYRKKLCCVNRIDFTGILERAYAELDDPVIRKLYTGQVILSDESQDCNPFLDWRILDKLRLLSKAFLLFASPSQEIFAFRGADYEKIKETYPPYIKNISLTESHRCTKEIVEVAKQLAGEDARRMTSSKGMSGTPVRWYQLANESVQTRFLAAKVLERLTQGIPASEIAILARNTQQLDRVKKAFNLYGILCHKVGNSTNIYKDPAVQRFTDYIKAVLRPDDEAVLDQIINYPAMGINEDIQVEIRGIQLLNWKHLSAVITEPEKYSQIAVKRASELVQYRESCKEILNAANTSVIEKILLIRNASKLSQRLYDRVELDAVKHIESVCQEAEHYESVDKFLDVLIERCAADSVEDNNSVNLCTFHSSKGSQWNTVCLIEDEKSSNCFTNREIRTAKNSAFVAMTRAQECLLISTNLNQGTPMYLDFYSSAMQQWTGRN